MLNAEPSAPSVPNIVIGMTPSPSSVGEIASPLSSKSEAAAAAVQLELPVTPSTPPAVAAPVRDTLMAPSMPESMDSDSHDEDEDDPEPASEERIRVAEKAEEAKVEAKTEAPAQNLNDTIIDAQKIEIVKPAEPKHDDMLVDAKAPKIEEPAKAEAQKPNFEKTLPFGEPLKKEEPKVEAKAETKTEAKAETSKQEDETVPPAGDLAVAEVAEQFFSEGDVARHASVDEEEEDVALDKAQRKSDPAVVKRRAKLAKYVTWAVGISAALCLIAVVRTTLTSSKSIAAANAAPVKSEVVVPKASPPPAVAPAPKPAETVAAATPSAEPAKASQPSVTGDVKEEKAKVKAALDKNKLADAIEAGERAVAIDPTDSEAWLLLGASYHQKGDLKEAQRAYHACLDQGTKDKFQRECRLFAR